jgi:hypothetical protein
MVAAKSNSQPILNLECIFLSKVGSSRARTTEVTSWSGISARMSTSSAVIESAAGSDISLNLTGRYPSVENARVAASSPPHERLITVLTMTILMIGGGTPCL